MTPDDDWTPGIVAVLAAIIAVVALLGSAAQCGEVDKFRGHVQHLEERLDNHLGDHP